MIALLAYVSAVSLLLVAAAWASEPLLHAVRVPVRTAWVVAMLGIVLAVLAGRFAPSRVAIVVASRDPQGIASGGGPLPAPMLRPAVLQPRKTGALPVGAGRRASALPISAERTAVLLGGLWALASLACLVRLLAGARRVARLRRSCRHGTIDGVSVLVSHDTGPAVIGAIRQCIVVPTWVEALPADAQRLIVAHEREHIRAHDHRVYHAALLLVALMPWNMALWLALPRLRAAIEIDCDARVLRTRRGAGAAYGRLLLEVGERSVAMAAPLLALAEPATVLERRIEAMTTRRRMRDWNTLLPATGALLLLAGAWRAPRPAVTVTTLASRASGSVAQTVNPRRKPLVTPSVAAPAPERDRSASWPASMWAALTSTPSLAATLTETSAAAVRGIALPDTDARYEDAMHRSAAAHQARIDAITDSVIRNVYPELMHRPAGTPAFLGLVLDDRDKLMRHAVSYDPALPRDLDRILLKLGIDTLSARTIGVGMSANNPWQVTVGHAVEMIGPPRGQSAYSATIGTEGSVRRIPYEHIVDSVARARTPEAFVAHPDTFAIAMVLERDGRVVAYEASPSKAALTNDRSIRETFRRLSGDPSWTGRQMGFIGHRVPSFVSIYWALRP